MLLILRYSAAFVGVEWVGRETGQGLATGSLDSRSNVLFFWFLQILVFMFELGLVATEGWFVGGDGGVVAGMLLEGLESTLRERLLLSWLIFLFNRRQTAHHRCIRYIQRLLTLHLPVPLLSSTFLWHWWLLLFLLHQPTLTCLYVPPYFPILLLHYLQ